MATIIQASAGGNYILSGATTWQSSFSSVASSATTTLALDDASRTIMVVQNVSSTASATVTLSAGDGTGSGIGTKAITVATDSTIVFTAPDSARYKNMAGGTAGTSGTMTFTATGILYVGALQIPKF